MPTYLERYLAGEREAVWAELTALGSAIGDEPLAMDAQAVARETMRRARSNVELLAQRLTALGYRFVSDVLGKAPMPYVPPRAESLATLRDLEAKYGALPLSIQMWYEVVGAVDFMGVYPGLSVYEGMGVQGYVDFMMGGERIRIHSDSPFYVFNARPSTEPADPNAGICSDPLVVWPCHEALVDEAEPEELEDDPEQLNGEPSIVYSVGFAPDALHKANVSGGDGPHIDFGAPRMDAPLRGDDWEGVPFISYLRTAFAWGGFPGLREAADPPRDLLASLCEALLPI
jgi:hypothetical protein